jgi:hypothetical protein
MTDVEILAWYESMEQSTIGNDYPEKGIIAHVRDLLAERERISERRGIERAVERLRTYASMPVNMVEQNEILEYAATQIAALAGEGKESKSAAQPQATPE